jgi:formylglycine-generating enzyme required for sulfatase activity
MGHHLVTQGEYQSVVGFNPSSFTGDLNLPVESVTWSDATNYCGLLTQGERAAGRLPAGWEYRLPTNAEWEYACRALTTTRSYWGDDLGHTNVGNFAWYDANSDNQLHPVGQKTANPWGLVDMQGNLWQWCQDWFDEYPGGSVTDPQGPATGIWSTRVGRGGSWYDDPTWCRSAARYDFPPTNPNYPAMVGFRVVLARSR